MIRKKLAVIIICFIVVLAIRYNTNLQRADSAEVSSGISITMLRALIPAASSFEKAIYEFKWSEIYGSGGEVLAFYTTSTDFADHIIGYSGPVPILIAADTEEQIIGIKLLDNRETPRYVSVIQRMGFFSNWDGLSAKDIAAHHVDAIAGATLTTDAVIKGVNLRMSDIYGILEGDADKKESLRSMVSIILGFLFTVFALLSYFIKRVRRYRLILLISSVVIMGFLKGELLSIFFFYNLISGGWSLGLFSSIGILAVISIILPLVTGRSFYCHFVCPFGAAQELLSKAGNKILIPKNIRKGLNSFRYIWFGVIAVVVVLGLSFDLSLIEPFSIFNYQTAHLVTIVLSLITAGASLFTTRPWCNFVCPTGTVFELIKV